LTRGDYPAAANLLERAERQVPGDDPARLEILLDLAECETAAGNVSEATAVFERLDALVGAGPGSAAAALVTVAGCELRMLSDPSRLRDDVAAVGAAIGALRASGDPGALARAHTVLGRALALIGRLAEAEGQLDRALVQARKAADTARARQVLLHLPLVALWGPQPVTRANGRLVDTLRILRLRPGNRRVEAETLRCMALLEATRGRVDAARTLLSSAQKIYAGGRCSCRPRMSAWCCAAPSCSTGRTSTP
jgi:tetratricopeptide (TPR) repeat protein